MGKLAIHTLYRHAGSRCCITGAGERERELFGYSIVYQNLVITSEERRRSLFVFIDTLEGPRAPELIAKTWYLESSVLQPLGIGPTCCFWLYVLQVNVLFVARPASPVKYSVASECAVVYVLEVLLYMLQHQVRLHMLQHQWSTVCNCLGLSV